MNSTGKIIISVGAFSMAFAVILGALGAHALENILAPEQLESFKTGVRYQAWHSLALLILGSTTNYLSEKRLKRIFWLLVLGIILFSFSIYILNLRYYFGIEGVGRFLGPVTPLGGILLILAWIYLGIIVLSKGKPHESSQ